MGDFNINLLNYKTDNPTSLFFDDVCSKSFFSYINITAPHTSRSKTFIDNILHDDFNGNTVYGSTIYGNSIWAQYMEYRNTVYGNTISYMMASVET